MAEQRLKLFVSSPGDLGSERQAVQRVVALINGDYLGVVHFDVIRWEEKSYSARAGFQSQIEEPSACDLVIAMLHSRLGTPLPIEVASRADGSAYESGTAYEIETSLVHGQRFGTPQLYMFRKFDHGEAQTPEDATQRAALAQFWERLFVDQGGRILRAFQSFSSESELQRQLDHCLRSWLLEKGVLRDAPVWNSAVLGSPFRGLAAFEESHAPVYFGRRVAVDAVWLRLLRAYDQGAGLLLLLGASGSGKSSLIKAGVVPRFRKHMNAHGLSLAHVCEMRPGNDPLGALANAERALSESQAGELGVDPELADVTPKYLLVIDQLEELFDHESAHVAEFASRCLELVKVRRFFLIASMRADCYASLLEHAELSALKDAGLSFDLRAPSDVDIEEMLRGPAAAAKLEFEKLPEGGDLADTILADLAGNDALAMMQLTLEELFQGREDSRLSFACYRQLGGVQGALLSAAESAFSGLDPAAQAMLPKLLSELVRGFGNTGEAICRPISFADPGAFDAAARARLIAAFVAKRLLVVDGTQLRVAHEALVRVWPRAVQVLEEIADAVQLRERISAPISEWQRDASALLPPGTLLFGAIALAEGKLGSLLSASEREFIQQSRDADRRSRSRRTRRLTLIAGAMSVLAVLALAMAWNAKLARDRARVSFAASVSAVNALTRDLAQNLRQSRGVRAETVASVLSNAQSLVSSIEKTDPGNVDLEYARIAMLLGFSETYRSVARSKEANTALDEALIRLRQLPSSANAAYAQLKVEADLAQAQRSYLQLDLADAERYARAAFDSPAFAGFGLDPALRLNAKSKLASTLLFQNKLDAVNALETVQALPSDVSGMTGDALADALDFYVALAAAKNELGQREIAKTLRTQASTLLDAALIQAPNSAQLLGARMRIKRAEASFLDDQQALKLLDQEIKLGQEAIAGNPNAALLRLAMKSLLNSRAQLYRKSANYALESLDLRAVVSMLAELSEQDPANLFLRAEVSFAQRRLANVLLARKPAVGSAEVLEAQTATLAALQIDRELIALSPQRPFARRYLAATLEQLGDLRKLQQQLSEALAAYQESLQLRLDLAHDFPAEFAWQRLIGLSYSAIKDVYARQYDKENALQAQRNASHAFAQVLAMAPSAAARFEWFDSVLFEVELLKLLDKTQEMRAQLKQLEAFATEHAAEFIARPDLLKVLKDLGATR